MSKQDSPAPAVYKEAMDPTRQSQPAPAQDIIRVGDHFYVLAVSSRADDRPRVLKADDTFAVFDRYGDILATGMGDQGLFHDGTRHLSRLDMTIAQARPLLLSSSLEEENLVLAVDLTNPDLSEEGRIVLPRGSLHILRSALIWEGVLHQRIQVHNYGVSPVEIDLALGFGADFLDMFEVRGVARARRGRLLGHRLEECEAVMEYVGLDGLRRSTWIACEPGSFHVSQDHLNAALRLASGEEKTFDVRVACSLADNQRPPSTPYDVALGRARQRILDLRRRGCEISTMNERFNTWANRSRADLRLMTTQTPHGPYPYAGIPWFSAPFGRDGIITALETLWIDPDIARGVLTFLAATQADVLDPASDAEPGKIVHEIRHGEMAATGEVPYARYYGGVDSTPLFVMLAGEYLRTTGDTALISQLWPHVRRALQWIDTYGDHDGDGFIDYKSSSSRGLRNQGWKDSHDSVFHDDGTLAEPPVALCEVQGYVYAAKRAAAAIAAALGDGAAAGELTRQAGDLQERFAEAYWDEDLGLYALALDGEKRPCRVASSNAGQCLFTGIARDDHAHRIIQDMLSPRFFSGWGIRTIASDQPRYNPMSYHNGSIWPHDTAMIAWGMARYGSPESAARLLGAMFDAASFAELYRMPELFCGFPRRAGEGPVRYPVACSPQSWAAGSLFMMLQACLGLSIRADRREIHFQHPTLPEFLPQVRLRNLPIGAVTIDLMVQSEGDGASVSVLRRPPAVSLILTK